MDGPPTSLTYVTDIMMSLIEGSNGPLQDYAKKEIDTFTGKIEQDYFLQGELMHSVGYQKLLTHKHAISQSKRVGARETEDTAPTMERTEDAEGGYVGPIYDAQEEKEQKVKGRYTKERAAVRIRPRARATYS